MAISSEIRSAGGMNRKAVRHGRAFLLEALAVLAFLMFSLAVFAKLFAGAEIEALRANRLSYATLLATNCAEEFSANPTSIPPVTEDGEYTVVCEVRPTRTDAGTLYEATITVRHATGDELYELQTARYVTGADGGGEAS